MKKKQIFYICAVLIFAIGFILGVIPAVQANAAIDANTLFTNKSGSASVNSGMDGGLQITFYKSAKDSNVVYKSSSGNENLPVDMKKFELTFAFKSGTANFESMVFRFTDIDNSTRWVEIWLKKDKAENSNIQYRMFDNFQKRTEFVKLDGFNTSLFETDLSLGYDSQSKSFYLSTGNLGGESKKTTLNSGDIEMLSFYKDIAHLEIGVREVDPGDDDNETVNAVLVLKIWKNSKVTQYLDSSDTNNYKETTPAIIREKTGGRTSKDIETLTNVGFDQPISGPYDYDYAFPYYCISILNRGWRLDAKVPDSGEFVDRGRDTKFKLDVKDGLYEFKIYDYSTAENPLLHIKLKAIKVEKKKTEEIFDYGNLEKLLKEFEFEDGSKFPDTIMFAPKLSNTYEFPSISAGSGVLNSNLDSNIWNYDNIKFVVGYKKPGSSSKWEWASGYNVKLDAVGEWKFCYRATDIAGFTYESGRNAATGFGFDITRWVEDDEPPVIDMPELIRASLIDTPYSVTSPTVSDNASGVNSAKTSFKVYHLLAPDKDGKQARGDEVKYEDEDLKTFLLGEVTPEGWGADAASFVVVYYAEDNADPANTATWEMKIRVTERVKDPEIENPVNPVLEVILIVIACISGVGLIAVILLVPAGGGPERKKKERKIKTKDGAESDDDDDDDDDETEKIVVEEEKK